MNINTAYNISLCVMLLIFFLAAYFLGSFLYSSDRNAVPEPVEKETDFYIASFPALNPVTPLESIPEPKDVEKNSYTVSEFYYDIPLSDEKQDYVFDMCEKYDVPCELVFAVMGADKIYDETRISGTGDYGIMQINQINHNDLSRELGVSDFLDYEQNVLCGVYMLSHYYHLYTDFNKIAMCYRYGEKGASEMWEQGIYSTDYTGQVIQAIALLKHR